MYKKVLAVLVFTLSITKNFAYRGLLFDNRMNFTEGYICNFERYEEVSGPLMVKYHCQLPSKCNHLKQYRTPIIPFNMCNIIMRPMQEYECCHPLDDRYKGPEKGYLPGMKSYTKCLEYTKHVCVNGTSSCHVQIEDRIHMGNSTSLKRYPYLALIGYPESDDYNWYCRGSIITSKHILTTASCEYYRKAGEEPRKGNRAIVGFQKICENYLGININCTSDAQVLESLHFLKHPAYDRRYYYHDIGVMVLLKDMEFNDRVRPACLFVPPNIEEVTGWLASYNPNASTEIPVVSFTPQHVQLTILTSRVCQHYFPRERSERFHPAVGIRRYEMFCAGQINSTRNSPCGDLDVGSAMVVMKKTPYCTWQIMGLLASNRACGTSAKPGIYTRVRYYLSWLESFLWPTYKLYKTNTNDPYCAAPKMDDGIERC